MSTGIVFYSRSNNTRAAAEYLAEKTAAEMVELLEKGSRNGLTGFIKSGYQAVKGKQSELQGEPWQKITGFKRIYLLSPIWGGNLTPAMNTFLHQANFDGKEVTVVTFQADAKGSGSEKVHQYMKSLIENGGGKYLRGIALHSAPPGRFAGADHIQRQADRILDA